jgi:hypothetical protein
MLSPASIAGAAPRRGEGTPPSIRDSFHNTANATSVVLTLPSTIQDGDIGIICASMITATNNLTTPTGWTLLGTKFSSNLQSSSPSCYSVYKKKLTRGADAGAAVTIVCSTSDVIVGVGTVVQGGSDVAVGPAFCSNNVDANVGAISDFITWPAIIPGPQDLVIFAGAAKAALSDGATDPLLVSAPTGFTLLKNIAAQSFPNLSPVCAAYLCSGPAVSATNVSTTSSTSGSDIIGGGCALSISPALHRPTDQVPPSLQGASLHGYGNSYLTWVSPPAGSSPAGGGSTSTHFSESLFIHRLASIMNGPFDFDGYGGGTASDICGGVYGSAVYYSRASSLDTNFAIQRAITWMGKSNRSGLVVLDCLGDDALAEYLGGNSAKCRAGAVNATDAMIRLFRASSVVEQTDASVTPPAHPTTSSASIYSGGSITSTTTPGDTFTITTTHPSIDLVLLAIDNSALGTTGAPFSVTVDGVAFATGTTSDQMLKSTSTNFAQAPSVQMCVPIYNMGSGTHTIVITHTGSAGQILCLDGYLIVSATPPIVLLNTIEHLDEAASGDTGINAVADTYSALAKSIQGRFPPGAVVLFDVVGMGGATVGAGPYTGAWNPTMMLNHSSGDFVHPLETGSAFYAHGMCRALQEQVS